MAAPESDGHPRSRILEAAARLISERGVHETRLADVAEEAGVSLGLVQHYFRRRERLLAEVFRREQDRISETWNAVVGPDTDALTRLVDYLRLSSPDGRRAVRAFDPGWSFWLEFWSRANRDDALRAEVRHIYAAFAELFTDAINDGVRDGMFHPRGTVEDAADRLISLIDGLAIRTLLGDIERSRMLPLLLDGLCAELGLDDELRSRAYARAGRRPPRKRGARRVGRSPRGEPRAPMASARRR